MLLPPPVPSTFAISPVVEFDHQPFPHPWYTLSSCQTMETVETYNSVIFVSRRGAKSFHRPLTSSLQACKSLYLILGYPIHVVSVQPSCDHVACFEFAL